MILQTDNEEGRNMRNRLVSEMLLLEALIESRMAQNLNFEMYLEKQEAIRKLVNLYK